MTSFNIDSTIMPGRAMDFVEGRRRMVQLMERAGRAVISIGLLWLILLSATTAAGAVSIASASELPAWSSAPVIDGLAEVPGTAVPEAMREPSSATVDAPAPPAEIVEFYAVDAIGSVRAVFAADGSVVTRGDYLPFGEALPNANLPPEQFTGRPRNSESSLDDFDARSYQLRTGRFISIDPSIAGAPEAPQRWNRYAYALNSPLLFVDPTGRNADSCRESSDVNENSKGDDTRTRDCKEDKPNSWLVALSYVVDLITVTAIGNDLEVPAQQQYQPSAGAKVAINTALLAVSIAAPWMASEAGGALASNAAREGAIEGAGTLSTLITNPVPGTLARVIPVGIETSTLGRSGQADVFVTAAEDIFGMSAEGIAERLAIPSSPRGFQVFEFPTPSSGLASPINRADPGFVGRGLTAGGAREFVLPNGPIPADSVVRIVH